MTKLRQKPTSIATDDEPQNNPAVKSFVAKSIDERAPYGVGDPSVARVKKTKITVPVEFHLATSNRPTQYEKITSTSPFRTTKLTTEGASKKREMKLTVPMSPNISKFTRIRQKEMVKEEPEPFVAKPAPHSKPFVPVIKHHRIEPLPIQLPGDAIAAEKRNRFQETLKKEREMAERARKFHARPAPELDPDHFPVS
jgi:hypothetical protein